MKDKLLKTKNGNDIERQLHENIFDVDVKIKEQERELKVLKRALNTQDSALKKYLLQAQDCAEATELERRLRQNDSLHRQILKTGG